MAQVLVPPPRLAVLSDAERALLARLVAAGAALGQFLAAEPEATMRAQRLVFRRWVLEAILALRVAPGPVRANVLARELGIRGESFAVKMHELAALGAVTRHASTGRPPAVEYTLTPAGRDLGSFTVALTAYKALQCDAALRGETTRLAVHARSDGEGLEARLAAASADAEALTTDYVAARGGDLGVRELRRYAETCVRRWHPPILIALTEGPLRFGELKAQTGAGDEATSRALRSLSALGAVQSMRDRYAITPWGEGDLALGSLLVAVPVAARPAALQPA